MTAPSRAAVNYSVQSDGATDRRAYRETEHQSHRLRGRRTDKETDKQVDRQTGGRKDHQNFPPGIFLFFIINNPIEF